MYSGRSWAAGLQRRLRHALILLPVLAPAACRSGGAPAAAPLAVDAARDATPRAPAQLAGPGPEWTEADRPRRFVGQDLFNHIDGAAELFLELGFREVIVRRYTDGTATLAHEVYEMKDATAARGIYLRFRGKGTPVAGVAGRNFGNRYQIAAQKDRTFVQVTNASGEERCLPAMVNLVNQATGAVPHDGDVTLLDLLPAEGLVPGSEVIVCGPYSLQSVFTLGEGDILQLQGQRCGIAGDYRTEPDGSFTRLIVAYGRGEVAQAAFQHLRQGLDAQLQVLRQDEHTVIFRDANGRFGSVTARNDQLDLRLHLVHDPGLAAPPG
jgi:hypothetical protein